MINSKTAIGYKLLAISSILVVLIFSSCKTHKSIQSSNIVVNTTPPVSLKKENKYSLMSKLKSKNFNFKWLSAHFSVDYDVDSNSHSFSGTVRIRKDSLIWMDISYLMLDFARVQLDQDSVKFVYYIGGNYFKGNYDYISDSLLGEDIDFDLINKVMLGNTLDFDNDTAKMKAYFDGTDNILSTIPKRKIKKHIYNNKRIHSKNDAQLIWLDSKDFHIKKVRLEDFVSHRIFEATYEDFQKVDSVMFPTHIHYEIKAEKLIKIDLRYKRVSFSDYEKTPFTIPKKYEQIRY